MMRPEQGHICSSCGSEHTIVEKTVNESGYYDHRKIRRRRCTHCGRRWVTVEIGYWDLKDLERGS